MSVIRLYSNEVSEGLERDNLLINRSIQPTQSMSCNVQFLIRQS